MVGRPTAPPSQVVSLAAQLEPAIKEAIHPHLQRLQEVRGRKVIAYFLAEEAALADEQVLHLYEHVRHLGKQEALDLWISSRGGATETPWKIIALLREYATRLSVLVPYRAHSAATLVALGADEIVMTEMSELGPIDPSRRHPLLPREEGQGGERKEIPISVQDLRHVLQFMEREIGKDLSSDAAATIYTALFDKVHPLAIGALEQSWTLARQVAERVLLTHMDSEKDRVAINAIVERLSDYYKSHTYQIGRREAREIGLKVADATPAEADAMWALYSAYGQLQFQGQAEVNGKQAPLVRLGHLDSEAGMTLGFGIVLPDGQGLSGRWESPWTGVAAAAQPAGRLGAVPLEQSAPASSQPA